MLKRWPPDRPLTPTQQDIVDKLRKGYTLTKNKGAGATLKGNGHGVDEQVDMRSVNGIINRGIINEAHKLSKDTPT